MQLAAHIFLLAQLESIPAEYLIAGGALLGIVLLVLVLRMLRRRRAEELEPPLDLTIDIAELGDQGPPLSLIALELYNLPVRLAAIVVAPTGRGSAFPPGMQLDQIVEYIVPGLSEIVREHKPLVRRWPAQLSTHGFSNTLFANVRLPGDRGRGTPWSVAAGRFEAENQNLLAGLVVRANQSNSLGQFVIDRPGQWLDLFRVRRS
jgi:hypothetical protein